MSVGHLWGKFLKSSETRINKGLLAERVGFEPTDEDRSSPVFKTGAFNRSATFPKKN